MRKLHLDVSLHPDCPYSQSADDVCVHPLVRRHLGLSSTECVSVGCCVPRASDPRCIQHEVDFSRHLNGVIEFVPSVPFFVKVWKVTQSTKRRFANPALKVFRNLRFLFVTRLLRATEIASFWMNGQDEYDCDYCANQLSGFEEVLKAMNLSCLFSCSGLTCPFRQRHLFLPGVVEGEYDPTKHNVLSAESDPLSFMPRAEQYRNVTEMEIRKRAQKMQVRMGWRPKVIRLRPWYSRSELEHIHAKYRRITEIIDSVSDYLVKEGESRASAVKRFKAERMRSFLFDRYWFYRIRFYIEKRQNSSHGRHLRKTEFVRFLLKTLGRMMLRQNVSSSRVALSQQRGHWKVFLSGK